MKHLRYLALLFSICLLIVFSYQILNAEQVFIKNFDDFPAYPYNTRNYWSVDIGYVGCGPTTTAMILGYFENTIGPGWLEPLTPADRNQGLETAKLLHQFMNTNANGFGSPYDIRSGIEQYIDNCPLNTFYTNKWDIKTLIHVSPLKTPPNATWDAYGPFGEAWTNDGYFWQKDLNDRWYIDVEDFCRWASVRLEKGIPIFLTIDSDAQAGGDHWVPMIGFDTSTDQYFFYDTTSTVMQSGPIIYENRTVGGGDRAIALVRTLAPRTTCPKITIETSSEVCFNFYFGKDKIIRYFIGGRLIPSCMVFNYEGVYEVTALATDTNNNNKMYCTFPVYVRNPIQYPFIPFWGIGWL